MSGALQAVFQNQRSFGPPPPTTIGEAYGGGYYAGQIGVSGTATHYLIVGPVASAQTETSWQNAQTDTPGTSSAIDGPANSTAMNDSDHAAAQFCKAVTTGGFTDWYMPAKNELEVCYYNLKPGTTSNSTGSGINANAVPARASNYTAGTPAQTSVTAFRTGNTEAFSAFSYWSSTQSNLNDGSRQSFNNGVQNTVNKTYSYRVRAVRRIPV